MDRRIVVIGGGVVGCSVAWHLASRQLGAVTLVEKESLGAGTTWHSAGNVTWKPGGDRDAEVLYLLDTVEGLAREGEQSIGWLRTGRMFLARDEEVLAPLRDMADAARARGFETEMLTPEAAAGRHPLLSPAHLAGVWLNGTSGRLDPAGLTAAYARAARRHGVEIVENCRVDGIAAEGGRVQAVRTDAGDLPADVVVVCSGLWSRDLLAPLDVALAQWGCEHFYVIAEPGERIARETPSFVSPADLLYGREDVGNFLFGCFDEAAVTLEPGALPDPFAFTLLDANWDKFAPYFEKILDFFPALEEAPIRRFVNGPESFTPDGHPLIGGVGSIDGLYVATGMNSHGVTISAAAGHNIADLIAGVPPRFDAVDYDPGRFGARAGDVAWLRATVADAPSGSYRESNL